jgi:transcriptional regulator with XRE-family HTH domain
MTTRYDVRGQCYDASVRRDRLRQLRDLRERASLTQKELAEKVGLSVSQVIRLEHGESSPRPSTARKLARALKVKIADLYEAPKDDHAETTR